ncbi:MAG: DUF748 domain-containing protein [Oceanospirillaceae bacterium]|nr:DUF748 domain-containing protein [Oceanospirillaceae bacterium]
MKWIKWGLGTLLIVLLVLQTAPYIIRDQAVIWLRQQGAEDVGLRALKLKWWQGRVEVDRLHAGAPGRLPLNVGLLALDIDVPQLFKQRLLVSELALNDVESGVRLSDGHLWLGPVDLSALQGSEPVTEPKAPEEPSEPSAWRFGIDRIRIENLDWRTELPAMQHHLELDAGELAQLYQWRDHEQSRLSLYGRLNGAPLDIDTEAVPLPLEKSSEMELTLQRFPIESVTAPFIPGLSGELSFQLSLSAELSGTDGRVRPEGRISLDNIGYRSETLNLDNQSLSWDGAVDLELKGLLPRQLDMKGSLAIEPLQLEQPDALNAGLQALSWKGDMALTFDSEALPQALKVQGGIELQQPAVSQAAGLEAGLEGVNWNGVIDLGFASGAPASLGLDGELMLANNRTRLPDTLDGTLAAASWKGNLALALEGGAPSSLQARGVLGLDDTRLTLPGTGDVGLQRARWEGTAGLAFADGQPQDLNLSGDLTLDNQRLQLAAQQVGASLARLGWSGTLKLQLPEANRQLEAEGMLKAGSLSAEAPQFSASLDELSWQGGASMVQQALSADGEIAASTLEFRQPERLVARLASLGSSLQLESPDLAAFNASIPALNVRALGVEGGRGDYPLVSLKSLDLEALTFSTPQDLALKVLRIDGLDVANAGKVPLSAIGQLQLSDVTLDNGERATAARLTISDSSSSLRLDKKGQPVDINVLLAVIDEIAASAQTSVGGTTTAATGSGKESGAGLGWQLDRLELGGKNRLSFEDGSTEPVFTTDLDISRFHVERLGSLITEPSPFELSARINEFSELEASGAVNLIGGVSDGEWKATLKGVELPRLSSYSIRYTGYFIDSGQLSVEADGTLSDRQLAGSNNIRLNRVKLERVDAGQSAELAKELSMPLETALELLQDKNDNIELDVPISGSLDSPDFGYQSVINIIVEKGVKTAAMGFLSNALQPYGALITLAGMAADASKTGSAIELAPVEFQPGSAELDGTANDYLNKITQMMQERKGLRLNLCGQAVIRDRSVLQPVLAEEQAAASEPLDQAGLDAELKRRLQALADARAAAVKDYLDEQVDGERLFLCFSRLALEEAESQPVVFLGL